MSHIVASVACLIDERVINPVQICLTGVHESTYKIRFASKHSFVSNLSKYIFKNTESKK